MKVAFQTTLGSITLELDAEKAPATVKNFVDYVNAGFFNGTIFHRVIKDFMIQGGGFTQDMSQKPTNPPIENEANNGLKNHRGTIAMARTPDPHSASAQFFINAKDNNFLDFSDETVEGWGYAVFGKVVEGMDIADKINNVQTHSHGLHHDVPVDPIIIEKAEVLESQD